MAMTVGAKGKGVVPVMNVTPLVDVVLVLLIIFMVITPLLMKRFYIYTPKQEKREVERQELPNEESQKPLVLRVGADKSISVNALQLSLDELPGRLRRMFAARDDHVLFFDADDDAPYGFAVQVMDQARAGGAATIAPLTARLESKPAAATLPGETAPLGAAPPGAVPPGAAPDMR